MRGTSELGGRSLLLAWELLPLGPLCVPPQPGWTCVLQQTLRLSEAPVPPQQGNHQAGSFLLLECLKSICSCPMPVPLNTTISHLASVARLSVLLAARLSSSTAVTSSRPLLGICPLVPTVCWGESMLPAHPCPLTWISSSPPFPPPLCLCCFPPCS